ncbi:hypothetical protein Tco_0459473 [Tanacetum coccineum]
MGLISHPTSRLPYLTLPPEAEVERLLAMTTPSPSPPSTITNPSTLQDIIHHYRLLIYAVTATDTAFNHHASLPPTPPDLYPYLSTPVTVGRNFPNQTGLPARGCICPLYAPDMRSERVPLLDLPERSIPEGHEDPSGLHERDTQDLYALLEDAQDGDIWMVEEEAYASREAWAHSIGLSQATHQELQTHRDHVYAHETLATRHKTPDSTTVQSNFSIQRHSNQGTTTRPFFICSRLFYQRFRDTDRRRLGPDWVETLRVNRDMKARYE